MQDKAGGELTWQSDPKKKKKLTEKNKGSPSVALWFNYLPHNRTTSSSVMLCLVTRLTPMGRRVISSSSRWPLQIELYIIWLDFKSIKPHLFTALELPLWLSDLWAQKWEHVRPLIPGLGWLFTFCEWCDTLRIFRKKMPRQSDDAAAAGVTCPGVGMVNNVLVVWNWAEVTSMSMKNVTKSIWEELKEFTLKYNEL